MLVGRAPESRVTMMGRVVRRGIAVLVVLAILGLGINFYVRSSESSRIMRGGDCSGLSDMDCVIVLGAGIWGDEPSPMLEDRLAKGLELYEAGVVPKIIMSGDHGQTDYDEVNLMKSYAKERGVPSEDVFMDHAGFSTYDSMYRAKHVFRAKRVVIVTQEYHLYRAVYIANQLGLDAYGVSTDPRIYGDEAFREAREILARDKDFFKCIAKPKSTFVGDPIPISGDGNATND